MGTLTESANELIDHLYENGNAEWKAVINSVCDSSTQRDNAVSKILNSEYYTMQNQVKALEGSSTKIMSQIWIEGTPVPAKSIVTLLKREGRVLQVGPSYGRALVLVNPSHIDDDADVDVNVDIESMMRTTLVQTQRYVTNVKEIKMELEKVTAERDALREERDNLTRQANQQAATTWA